MLIRNIETDRYRDITVEWHAALEHKINASELDTGRNAGLDVRSRKGTMIQNRDMGPGHCNAMQGLHTRREYDYGFQLRGHLFFGDIF